MAPSLYLQLPPEHSNWVLDIRVQVGWLRCPTCGSLRPYMVNKPADIEDLNDDYDTRWIEKNWTLKPIGKKKNTRTCRSLINNSWDCRGPSVMAVVRGEWREALTAAYRLGGEEGLLTLTLSIPWHKQTV